MGPPPVPAISKPKVRVLVIDDDPVTLEIVRERLDAAGYDVIVREEAIGTSEVVMTEHPDVVLIDVMMPGLSGDKLARLLSGNARTRDTKIVLHSSRDAADLERIAVECGAIGALEKTHDGPAFMAGLERLLRSARLHDRISSTG